MADEDTTVLADNPTEVSDTDQVNTKTDPGYMAAVKGDLREKYGDELRQYQNINPIIEDYFTLKAKSEKAIYKPDEKATPEEIAKYKESMGIPPDAKDYELDKAPEGSEDFETWFRDTALTASLTKDQAKAFYDSWNKVQLDGENAKREALVETEKAMRKEFGSDYESAIANASKIVQMGGEDLAAWLDETGAGNDPRFVRVFTKLGSMVSEDSIGRTQSTQQGSSLSLAERMYPTQGK